MNPGAPWTERIFELLADGPQPLEFLIASTRNMVPPGRAFRKAEQKREQQAARRVNKTDRVGWTRDPSEDETIRTGQRQIVMDSITKMVARGRLEYVEGDTGRSLQIGRDPLPNGMATSDLVKKLHEHEAEYTKRRLPGEYSEITGRAIDVIDIECSCGWTWSGGRQDPDGDWHIHATSKGEAAKAFTRHRRSFV